VILAWWRCLATDDFRTLPFYLYQQIGAYRGARTAQ
jgi:ABC-type Fe3+ transport system permease subunit